MVVYVFFTILLNEMTIIIIKYVFGVNIEVVTLTSYNNLHNVGNVPIFLQTRARSAHDRENRFSFGDEG